MNALNLTVARYLERGRSLVFARRSGLPPAGDPARIAGSRVVELVGFDLGSRVGRGTVAFVCRWVGLDFAVGAFRLPEFWSMAAACFIGELCLPDCILHSC